MKVQIDQEKCIRCEICFRECPSSVIELDADDGYPFYRDPSPAGACISCSHCAILCPTAAITLDFLPADKRREADLSLLPKPEQYQTLMATRRSVRQFKPEGLPRQEINRILEIANLAPTATNSQKVHWLITEPETTRKLRERAEELVNKLAAEAPDDVFAQRHIYRFSLEIDSIFRTAPHAAIALVPADYFWADDGIIALTHFDNACHALGYGSCWGGLLRNLLADYAELRAMLGIGDDFKVCNTILFGARVLPITDQLPLREPLKVRYT